MYQSGQPIIRLNPARSIPITTGQPPPQRNFPNLVPAQNLPHTIALLLRTNWRNLDIDHNESLLDLRAHAIDGMEPMPGALSVNLLLPGVSFPSFALVCGKDHDGKLGMCEGGAAIVNDYGGAQQSQSTEDLQSETYGSRRKT